jgi:hypothetical protein
MMAGINDQYVRVLTTVKIRREGKIIIWWNVNREFESGWLHATGFAPSVKVALTRIEGDSGE